jgi:hypothetical protein
VGRFVSLEEYRLGVLEVVVRLEGHTKIRSNKATPGICNGSRGTIASPGVWADSNNVLKEARWWWCDVKVDLHGKVPSGECRNETLR